MHHNGNIRSACIFLPFCKYILHGVYGVCVCVYYMTLCMCNVMRLLACSHCRAVEVHRVIRMYAEQWRLRCLHLMHNGTKRWFSSTKNARIVNLLLVNGL